MQTLLILREAGGVGDVLMTLPVARWYKENGWRVWYLTLSGYAPIVRWTGLADKVFEVSRTMRRGRDVRPTERYLRGLGIDLDAVDRIADLWCPAWRHEVASGGRPWLNRIECFWRASGLSLDLLGDDPMRGVLPVPPRPDTAPDGAYVAIQAHTQDPARNVSQTLYWPLVLEAAEHGMTAVAFGVKREAVESVVAEHHVVSLEFPALCGLIANASVLLCGDSAPVHIAAAYGVETHAWFGPTNGRLICRRYPTVQVHQGRGCARGGCYYQPGRGWNECRFDPGYCVALREGRRT